MVKSYGLITALIEKSNANPYGLKKIIQMEIKPKSTGKKFTIAKQGIPMNQI